jgi:hypothetical protein
MNHPWRKALIALAIFMIPVYIGMFLYWKQEQFEFESPAEKIELRPTPNPSQGHGQPL